MYIVIQNRIVKLREQKGWTQIDLAKKVGITRQSLASIERGKYSLSLELAFKISRVLEVPLNEAFRDTEEFKKAEKNGGWA